MENDLMNMPGLIILNDKIVRTPKVKKWIDKNKPFNYRIQYLENPPTDRSAIERELKSLENKMLGIEEKPKEVFPDNDCRYEYRIRQNEILKAYTEEQMALLKKWYNICD